MSTRARRRAPRRPAHAAVALVAAVALAALPLAACTPDGPAPPPSATAAPAPGVTSPPAAPPPSAGPAPTPTGTDGAPSGPEPSPAVTAPAGGTAGEGPADDAPFPADTSADTADPGAGARLGVQDVRVGAHDGYDRVVLDLTGTGTPGWWAEYTDAPTQDGSGAAVTVAGGAVLAVVVTGTTYPGEGGVLPYAGPGRLVPTGTGAVVEVVHGTVFEGSTSVWVGVDERRPFRVTALADPPRVVVDVRTG